MSDDQNPGPPHFQCPPNACDTHFHLFGPQGDYPFSGEATYAAPDASLAALRRLHAGLGLTRGVISNANVYGRNHRIAADAIAQSEGRLRGIANVDVSTTESELEMLSAKGFRGCRFRLLDPASGQADVPLLQRVAAMCAPLGWHLDLLIDASALPDWQLILSRLPLPYVIDHMGRVDTRKGCDDPGFQALLRQLRDDERCWVKLSGADRMTAASRSLSDIVPFAQALMGGAPDRVLWGTDWPHTNVVRTPSDRDLVDLISLYAPDEAAQHRLLVTNPARLYGF